jgi:hypothetical protein
MVWELHVHVQHCQPQARHTPSTKRAPGCVAARSVLAHRLEPLRSLLTSSAGLSNDDVTELSATELRDALLVLDPINRDWVARVNQAEAEFWKR